MSGDRTLEERFWAKVTKAGQDDCWLWAASKRRKGYGSFRIHRVTQSAHRVAWELVNGPIPIGLIVCHRCDNAPCVNPAHLFLGTYSQNLVDAFAKGRRKSAPPAYSGKLDAADVAGIRAMRAAGAQLQRIADRFGISDTHVSAIALGKSRRATA